MTVLITGATDGIGRALAGIYRARGDRLVLVGRRALDSLEGGLFSDETYCEADLSEPDCAERVEFVSERAGDRFIGSGHSKRGNGILRFRRGSERRAAFGRLSRSISSRRCA